MSLKHLRQTTLKTLSANYLPLKQLGILNFKNGRRQLRKLNVWVRDKRFSTRLYAEQSTRLMHIKNYLLSG